MIGRILPHGALLAGPLVLVGFFLPWFDGHGPLAGEHYNGYNALQFGAWLRSAGFGPATNATLLASRFCIVALPVAGIFLTALAPIDQRHALYRIAGTYVALSAVVLASATVAWNDSPVPLPGVLCIAVAAAFWVIPSLRALRSSTPAESRPPVAAA